jgi:hypothetical protein
MNSSASPFGLGSEFDAFLFAPIGEDRNGLLLRIVSLLGRLDLDPWQEASNLAQLPMDAAAQKLASLLATLPVPSLRQADLSTVATHLVGLLPHQSHLAGRSLGMLGTDAMAHPRLAMRAILFAIWLIWLLSLQSLMTRHDAPAAPVSMPQSAASQTPAAK